jgi:nitroreductase
VVTDQGGLVAGRMIGPGESAPGQGLVEGSDKELAGSVLTAAAIATVVGTAARAPSVHNTQPWRFRVVGDVIELHADPDRMLALIDPVSRELIISCGAALFGLRLGLRQLGYVPAVQLWPDPGQPWLVGRVWPAGHTTMSAIEAELLAAVPHRHTHRGPFTPGEVSTRLLSALAVDAAAEGAALTFVESPRLVSKLAALVEHAAADQDASAAVSAETRRWHRPDGSQAGDGVPARSAATSGEQSVQRFRQRTFSAPASPNKQATGELVADDGAGVAPAATAVLVTGADTPDDWLRAGQALNRLLLRAATRWVFASLHSQPLEIPRYREQVRDLLSIPGQPQMLLQFGRSNTALATPRRRQAEFRTNGNQA